MLLWHSALELFLHLAAEHLGAENSDRDRAKIMEYFPPINAKLGAAGPLPQKEALQRMNKARGLLKHSAVPPARDSIDEAERTLARFFEQAVPMVFGIPIEQASLIKFVRSEAAREALEVAGQALKSEDLRDGLTSCAKAFQHVIDDYEVRVQKRFGKSTFVGGSFHVTEAQRPLMRIRHVGNPAYREPDYDLRAGLNALSLGLDHRSYIRFRLLTPDRVSSEVTGRRVDKWFFPSKAPTPTSDDLRYCIDFVIESALRIQEFSFVYQEEGDGH